jgi:aspartate carbamoyltransferase regulatory subunit
MVKVVGWVPFPWECGNPRCNSEEIIIIPTNNPKDTQEIEVRCKHCNNIFYTSGSIQNLEKLDEHSSKLTEIEE